MLKINRQIGIATLLLLLTGQCIAMSKNDTKFEWLATESAPAHYPMKIIQGTFIYHGEAEQGLYIPSGGTLSAGWGQAISGHTAGERLKPLPDRLKIIFFSYAEKQFYKGEFDLPYEKILALFRDGTTVNPHVRSDGSTVPAYSRIMVGIAPGGAVAVWLIAPRKTEVFFGQAQKVEIDPGRAFGLPFKSKEQADTYIREVLEESITPKELESLKKNGIPFGLWARYRNRYDWQPTVSKGHSFENVNVSYLNGEYISNWDLTDKKEMNNPKPVPMKASFHSAMNDKKLIFEMEFDEQEAMAAFEKLGANGKKVYLEFEPRLPKIQTKVRLYNDKESIELKKFISIRK